MQENKSKFIMPW